MLIHSFLTLLRDKSIDMDATGAKVAAGTGTNSETFQDKRTVSHHIAGKLIETLKKLGPAQQAEANLEMTDTISQLRTDLEALMNKATDEPLPSPEPRAKPKRHMLYRLPSSPAHAGSRNTEK
jgi:hypothetical protein